MRTYRWIFTLLSAFPLLLSAQTSSSSAQINSSSAQANSSDDIFTISVAAPISAKDVQVRYFLNGDPTVQQSSSIAKPDDQRIEVKTGADGKPAKSFRAIVFAPGCQFLTVQADDLASSKRQADFQCQKLSTAPLSGRADVSRFAGRDLQVEALYVCGWAGQFFGMPGIAISPFSVAKGKVEADGSFTIDLPDFSTDPTWANLSHNATLMLNLVDVKTGERVARLSAPGNVSRKGALKVAASYPPDLQFAVRQ